MQNGLLQLRSDISESYMHIPRPSDSEPTIRFKHPPCFSDTKAGHAIKEAWYKEWSRQ